MMHVPPPTDQLIPNTGQARFPRPTQDISFARIAHKLSGEDNVMQSVASPEDLMPRADVLVEQGASGTDPLGGVPKKLSLAGRTYMMHDIDQANHIVIIRGRLLR